MSGIVPADGGPELHPVISVTDGDTIRIARNGVDERVRLIGIDSPELHDDRGTVQCFSREATAFAEQLLVGRTVRIRTDPTQSERDRYDRLLAYVWLDDGTFINEAMVAEGYAHEYTYDMPYEFQAEFRDAQRRATEAGRGLWSPDTCGGDTSQSGAAGVGSGGEASAPLAAIGGAVAGGGEASRGVVIRYIFYDGTLGRFEPDEYAEVANESGAPVNLLNWRLNADDEGQDFVFPDFLLPPGQTCRVYTNQIHDEHGGFTYSNGQALWANIGECGRLYDETGTLVSEYCYSGN